MSQTTSHATGKSYGLKRVCDVWGVARSSIYRRQKQAGKEACKKKGPRPKVEEKELLEKIRQDLAISPFRGEGHRKVHARLKRQGVKTGRNRVLNVMKKNQLLSPHRSVYKPRNPHDGQIITEAPSIMWGSDGTKIRTVKDGWVWIFSVAEHWNTECLGWNVCKVGDRFAALEPVLDAVKKIYGSLSKGVAAGLELRIDNGSQYTSDYFLQQLAHLGVESSFGLVRQPETNGVAERFHRTLKEQILEGRSFEDVREVREAVRQFVDVYNEQWLVAKLKYQSPLEARRRWEELKGVA